MTHGSTLQSDLIPTTLRFAPLSTRLIDWRRPGKPLRGRPR